MIVQHKPLFDKFDARAVSRIITSGWISEGEETKKFQESFRKFVQTKYAIAVSSGTAAIFLALEAVGVKPNDEVIVPNITFVATATAVKLLRAKPIIADISEKDFTISINSIRKKITKKTTAVIPVHLNGRSTDLDELQEICDKNNLQLVEDASQALGSKYKKKYLGSIGNAAAFSLAPTKIITTGQGGMVTTNDYEIYEKIRKIKDQGRSDKSDNHQVVGYNFKITDIQGALGNSQFTKLKKRISWLQKIHKRYYELLKYNKNIIIPYKRPETLLWYFDILAQKRDELTDYLLKHDIMARKFYKPVSHHPPYSTKEKFPISEKISSLGLFMPAAADLTLNQVDYICKTINSFYKK